VIEAKAVEQVKAVKKAKKLAVRAKETAMKVE